MKRILVTGAAGFIGYHLVESLLKIGYTVIGIDNLNDYYDVNLKFDRLNESGILKRKIKANSKIQSESHINYSFIKSDITDFQYLHKLFSQENFEIVINMAAQAGVRYSIENPHAYVNSNLVGFINILECCRNFNIGHLIYASSSSVYGNNKKVPFSEEDSVDYPVSLYAATKKANELMAHTYSHLFKLPTTGLRLFTVYGPWGRPDMAPILFATAIKDQKPIKVFNNGKLERDFTYIDDIIIGIIKTIDFPPKANFEHPFYQVFNIGNSKKVKLLDFIQTLEDIMGRSTEKLFLPMQEGDVLSTWADSKKIAESIGFIPAVGIKEGLEKFVSWYKEYYRDNPIY
jgi:UDP-glucuronate 4-epimerase